MLPGATVDGVRRAAARVVWDRTDELHRPARCAAARRHQRRHHPRPGLFGVFLAGAEKPARVGELDEEMVYESRVGDVFLLGSTSWRIEDITPDRVLVSPAPGGRADAVLEGRLPGPAGRAGPGDRRPAARLAKARRRARPALTRPTARRVGRRQPAAYLREQREATRHLPTTARSWSSGSATSWATGG
jgi:ATP-dependent Lhr-like helicase